jgi:hypothetical protein
LKNWLLLFTFILQGTKQMENENIYAKIREIFGHIPDNLSVLQEQIDIDLQMEYYECAKNSRTDLSPAQIELHKKALYSNKKSVNEKKEILVQLAAQDNIQLFRFIQKFGDDCETELKEWTVLALQESRMLLETKLLDENHVFISTGLGGKGALLRYFIVLLSKKRSAFNKMQKKVIRGEFEFLLNKNDSELESIEFYDKFVTMVVLIPLHITIKEFFREGIDECNQFGNFLRSNFLVTNVKRLSADEINEFLRTHKANRKPRKRKKEES